jgi:hypothetical protein
VKQQTKVNRSVDDSRAVCFYEPLSTMRATVEVVNGIPLNVYLKFPGGSDVTLGCNKFLEVMEPLKAAAFEIESMFSQGEPT